MRILYIGQYRDGTTSMMRANMLQKIPEPEHFQIIDTLIPFYNTNKLFRSFGFRYKKGPLISRINNFIRNELHILANSEFKDKRCLYDMIWVDKAVFINLKTTRLLRNHTNRLIHFTPDPAFVFHKSVHFMKSIGYYDFCVTTKQYEVVRYLEYISKKKIIIITQGYDKQLHRKLKDFRNRIIGVVYIGHRELHHEKQIISLLENGIHVALGGRSWDKFYAKYKNNKNLEYLGTGVYGEKYVEKLNDFSFGLGLVSKWIPELHTTRTFEIPACGTALLTEKNSETEKFFKPDEAIFYDSPEIMIEKIKYYKKNPIELQSLSEKGRERVKKDGRDYGSILKDILEKIGILEKLKKE